MPALLQKMTIDDKARLIQIIAQSMQNELEHILKSAHAARGGAIHEDAIAKSKYDTHGLELSYLAGSQFERARILERDIEGFTKYYRSRNAIDTSVGKGSIVELIKVSQQISKLFFLSEFGSGLTVRWENADVLVLSPDSLLGIELLDAVQGDFISTKNDADSEWLVEAVL